MTLTKEEMDEFTEDFIKDESDDLEQETNEAADKADEVENATESTIDQEDSVEDAVDTSPEPSDGSSIWNDASTEQLEEVKRLQSTAAQLQHSADSDRGRVKALRAEAEQLRSENANLKKAKVEIVDDADDDDSKYTEDELDDLETDLPEVAAIVKRYAKPASSDQAETQQTEVTQQSQQTRESGPTQAEIATAQQIRNQMVATVKQSVPDLDTIVRDPNYATWLGRRPEGIRAMASSHKAEDAIFVLQAYKDARKSVNHDEELDSMTDLPKKGGTKQTNEVMEDDFDAAFEFFGNKIDEGTPSTY